MSSPIVAGAIALWLQAKPDLTPEEIKEILSRTCKHPPDDEYPNNTYGYGEIDVYAGLCDILGVSKMEQISKERPSEVSFLVKDRFLAVVDKKTGMPFFDDFTLQIYSLNGAKVIETRDNSVSLSALSDGVYAVQINTDQKRTTGSSLIRLKYEKTLYH